MASITYTFTDASGFLATCLIEEVDGNLVFTIDVDESTGQTADLRGLFFDLNRDDQTFLDSLSIEGADITDSEFKADSVVNLGSGDNVNGSVVNETGLFDAGIEIGTQGISQDDIQQTTFTLSSSLGDLTLDMITNVDTALRCTSSGEVDGSRNGSLKLLGDVSSGVISGRYFDDVNGDNVDDAGDGSIAGRHVSLFMADGTTPAVDVNGVAVTDAITASDGTYIFTNLAAGDYVVKFESVDGKSFVEQDFGTDDAIDSDAGATGMTGLITVTAGSETTDVDAGVKAPPPGSISGRYFSDENHDAVDDAGDLAVAGKSVTLLNTDGTAAHDIDGNLVGATTTAADGSYSFDNLAAGEYVVQFEDSSADGMTFVAQDAGDDETVDSDVDAAGMTGPVGVLAGGLTADVDAGVEAPLTPESEVTNSLSGTIETSGAATQSLTVIFDGSYSTYDQFFGATAGDLNGDFVDNMIDVMLARVVDRAQDLAADQQIDLILAGDFGVLGQQTIMAGDVQGLDPADAADLATLQGMFGPVFNQPFGLPEDVDFGAALMAAGDAITDAYGTTGQDIDQIVVLTSSDGIDFLGNPVGDPATVADALSQGPMQADIEVIATDDPFGDTSLLATIDSNTLQVIDPLSDTFDLDMTIDSNPMVSLGDVIDLVVGGEQMAVTDQTPADDGQFVFSLSDLSVDPSTGVLVEIDTTGDGVADHQVDVTDSLVSDGSGGFSFDLQLTDTLLA